MDYKEIKQKEDAVCCIITYALENKNIYSTFREFNELIESEIVEYEETMREIQDLAYKARSLLKEMEKARLEIR